MVDCLGGEDPMKRVANGETTTGLEEWQQRHMLTAQQMRLLGLAREPLT